MARREDQRRVGASQIGAYEGLDMWLIPRGNKVSVIRRDPEGKVPDRVFSDHYEPGAWYNAVTCASAMMVEETELRQRQKLKASANQPE